MINDPSWSFYIPPLSDIEMLLNRKQLETAARYLCKMRNVHPDNVVLVNTPAADVGALCAEWENAAREIEAHELKSEAIRFGFGLAVQDSLPALDS